MGTIGGGCGGRKSGRRDGDRRDGQPRFVTVDLTARDGDDKICGGIMHIFIERVSG
jgi:xanthine/CO dehydrogenase XdhC/CoxF family maturation factor